MGISVSMKYFLLGSTIEWCTILSPPRILCSWTEDVRVKVTFMKSLFYKTNMVQWAVSAQKGNNREVTNQDWGALGKFEFSKLAWYPYHSLWYPLFMNSQDLPTNFKKIAGACLYLLKATKKRRSPSCKASLYALMFCLSVAQIPSKTRLTSVVRDGSSVSSPVCLAA